VKNIVGVRFAMPGPLRGRSGDRADLPDIIGEARDLGLAGKAGVLQAGYRNHCRDYPDGGDRPAGSVRNLVRMHTGFADLGTRRTVERARRAYPQGTADIGELMQIEDQGPIRPWRYENLPSAEQANSG